jgi:NAD(P)-dependent dehydrogenase (short-subunit alcohol dehydrogenase family)
MSFDHHHIVITGGTGALGSAVASWFLERGATCHIPWLHEKELDRFPHVKHERVHLYAKVELTDEPAVERFYAAVSIAVDKASDAARPWASIHIAGGFAFGEIEGVRKADFVSLMQTNALTAFLCGREAVKLFGGKAKNATTPGGRIVNVAARPALEPRTGAKMVAYTAAKSAVAGLTQALAEEVVARGILVNAVVPSIMDTPANRASMPGADYSKWAKVEDVAATIGFLASPENTVTRGGLVPVYGGA